MPVVEGAERGDHIAADPGGFQNGQALFYLIGLAFDLDIYFCHCFSLLHSLLMALNLQDAMQRPHLMHLSGSITREGSL